MPNIARSFWTTWPPWACRPSTRQWRRTWAWLVTSYSQNSLSTNTTDQSVRPARSTTVMDVSFYWRISSKLYHYLRKCKNFIGNQSSQLITVKSLLQAASVLMTQNGTERSDHYKKVPTKCQASLSLIFLNKTQLLWCVCRVKTVALCHRHYCQSIKLAANCLDNRNRT